MARYDVTVRGIVAVESTVTITADTAQEAMALANTMVDSVVASALAWDIVEDATVQDIRAVDAQEIEE